MKEVKCPLCRGKVQRYGKTKAGSQRWFCRSCNYSFVQRIDNMAKICQSFLSWLFSKQRQKDMPGGGRTFRRKTSHLWAIWPMPPRIEERRKVIYFDGIYMRRKAVILICRDDKHVLGWYLCRYEHGAAWMALMSRIAEPELVVSDGGSGFAKALRCLWPNARHQRCLFHVFSQIRRYTTRNPQTLPGMELYQLGLILLKIKTLKQADEWVKQFHSWLERNHDFLNEKSRDENGRYRYTHERLVKAKNMLISLSNSGTMFTFLDPELSRNKKLPSTNNRIEGGVNAQLRAMLREHRGLSLERRLKAVYWWCYMHSPRPLPIAEILKVMPTDRSISAIYERMQQKETLEKSLAEWGDAVVWSELHQSGPFPISWD